jgi:hypothetical protein
MRVQAGARLTLGLPHTWVRRMRASGRAQGPPQLLDLLLDLFLSASLAGGGRLRQPMETTPPPPSSHASPQRPGCAHAHVLKLLL